MNNLNKLAKQFHKKAKAKGFWDEPKETGTLLMLMVSELSEALEADRKNRYAKLPFLTFDVNSGIDFKEAFEHNVKDSHEDEIADVFIRLMDYVGYKKIDIEKHIELKMKYNETRPYKHGKKY